MDAKQAGQVGAAALVFALIGLVTAVALGVYVLYYQKDSSAKPSDKPKMSGYGARMTPMVHSASAPPVSRYPPMPPMAQHAQGQPFQVQGAMYAAPPIPRTVASGPVGTFFEDELPQA